MFPIFKALVNYFTGRELFDDGDDVLLDKSKDSSVLVKDVGEKKRELSDENFTIEDLEEEIRAIEGWEGELSNIEEAGEEWKNGEENNVAVESQILNVEQVCETEICIDASAKSSCELCEYRVGTVTKLFRDYGIIDENLKFNTKDIEIKNLRKGVTVNYIAYRKTAETTWLVHKILAIADESWEENKNEQKSEVLKKSGAIERKLIGQVEFRKEREIFVKPNIKFCLDNVEADFIPYKGDWLSLNALVELDADVQDFVGEVLTVHGIEPLRSKVISGTITYWDECKKEGIIDQNVWFSKTECEPEFQPFVEASVVVQAIESIQRACTWRALSVVSLSYKRDTAKSEALVKERKIKDDFESPACVKNGMLVPKYLDFGTVRVGQKKEHSIDVTNVGKDEHILMRGRFHGKKCESQIVLLSRIDDGTIIGPGQTIPCRFRICGKFLGRSTEMFVFTFKGFKMTCRIDVEVYDSSLSDLITQDLNGPKKYKNTYAAARKFHLERRDENVMRGVQPVKPPAFVPVKFSTYRVPEHFWNVILGEDKQEASSSKMITRVGEAIPFLNKELSFDNYCARFHSLLHIEEIDLNIQIHKYDMEGVVLDFVGGEYLSLKVPGLAEKRPSIMIGDKINVECSTSPDYTYEGYVHKVCATEVWLKFHSHFHQTYNSEQCWVHFSVSRGPIKRCHVAIDLVVKHLGEHVLFPKSLIVKEPQVNLLENDGGSSHSNSYKKVGHVTPRRCWIFGPAGLRNSIRGTLRNGAPDYCEPGKQYLSALPAPRISKKPVTLQLFNPSLNYYQREAVRHALKGEARPLPYVIFGPPGTGKTITLVETILQIYCLIPDSRILVATPSNSSANLIAERLLVSKLLSPGDLVRLMAYHCLEEGIVPESLLPYCTTCDISSPRNGESAPITYKLRKSSNAAVLGRHRITVGTCIALGQLYTMGFPSGHFTHVCVDEAGQATEPEIMIPLGFLHSDWGQAILAGDPLQLGPVVSSRTSLHYGLGYSYLARLLERCPYRQDPCSFKSTGGYNPKLVTRLVMNYRSLPEILSLPSTLFYDSQLQPQVTETGLEGVILKSLEKFLPKSNKSLPPSLVFHGIRGQNFQDSDGPSWFNPQEIVQVIYYLQDFLDSGLTPDHIGVITPYQKQVQRLRSLLTQLEIPVPKIGSVEEFQGQERFVIILSTVRSTPKFIKSDLRYSLGFVASAQRLNVALTRARALLVIIGNPHLLSCDSYWRKTLAYCIDRDAYVGCDLPKDFMDFSNEASNVDNFENEDS